MNVVNQKQTSSIRLDSHVNNALFTPVAVIIVCALGTLCKEQAITGLLICIEHHIIFKYRVRSNYERFFCSCLIIDLLLGIQETQYSRTVFRGEQREWKNHFYLIYWIPFDQFSTFQDHGEQFASIQQVTGLNHFLIWN